jgi:hypothetical protein
MCIRNLYLTRMRRTGTMGGGNGTDRRDGHNLEPSQAEHLPYDQPLAHWVRPDDAENVELQFTAFDWGASVSRVNYETGAILERYELIFQRADAP